MDMCIKMSTVTLHRRRSRVGLGQAVGQIDYIGKELVGGRNSS